MPACKKPDLTFGTACDLCTTFTLLSVMLFEGVELRTADNLALASLNPSAQVCITCNVSPRAL